MKKLFLTMLIAIVAVSTKAQIYAGGELGFWRDYDENHTNFTVKPEVGYHLSDKWAIGINIGYEYNYTKGTKANTVEVSPYARYTVVTWGSVNLFLDGGFGFSTTKIKDVDDSSNGWEIGIKPGLSVDLTDKLSFITHVGFLGFRDYDKNAKQEFGQEGFGFNVDGNDLTFGLIYNF